jgi:hypothetical protein
MALLAIKDLWNLNIYEDEVHVAQLEPTSILCFLIVLQCVPKVTVGFQNIISIKQNMVHT